MELNTRFLDEFGVKYLTGSDNDTCFMTPCDLGAGGPCRGAA